MSLQPACMRAAARSGPILTQEAWMLGSAFCSVSRATACIRKHSCSVGPFLARPAKEVPFIKPKLDAARQQSG